MAITHFPLRAACLSLTLGILAGCGFSGSSTGAAGEVYDPGEPVNRVIFAGNRVADDYIIAPVARGYRDYVPQPVRRSVGNFVSNFRSPTVLANDLLQGNVRRAWTTTQRLVVNSTAGVGGLFDVAAELDLPPHDADLGQTFGVWGIGPGPAVQLPLLGPTNMRDATGRIVSLVANPLSLIVPGETVSAIGQGTTAAGLVHGRSGQLEATDALQASSLDYYTSLRSVEAQRRRAFVAEGIRGGPGIVLPTSTGR